MSNLEHENVHALLPWYLTGAIDAADRVKVEAHLPECSHCRAELAEERRLMTLWQAAPVEADDSWARLHERLTDERAPARPARVPLAWARWPRMPGWRSVAPGLGWALAAVQALTLVVIGLNMPAQPRASLYHALAAPASDTRGNVVVMFRPEASQRAIGALLTGNHARFVDGPTSAGAYLLQTPPAERAAILARLTRSGLIALAQPVDPGPPS